MAYIANQSLSGVKDKVIDQVTDQVMSFMNTSLMQQILNTVGTFITAGTGKVLVAKLTVVLSHAISATALKSVVMSVVKKIGVTTIAKSAVGKSLSALLALFGLSANVAFAIALIPVIGIFMVHEYKSFPKKLAGKIPSKVVDDLRGNFDRLNNQIIRQMMEELSKQISKQQTGSKSKTVWSTWKGKLKWIIPFVLSLGVSLFALLMCGTEKKYTSVGMHNNYEDTRIDAKEERPSDIASEESQNLGEQFLEESSTNSTCSIEYYVKKENTFSYAELYSIIDRKDCKVPLPNDMCLEIIAQEDFDEDGIKDALIEDIVACGGNMCGNSYFFVSYKGDGNFIVTKSFADDIYKKPLVEDWNGKRSVYIEYFDSKEIQTIKERFVYNDGDAILVERIKSGRKAAIKEIIVSDFHEEGEMKRIVYDLDENGVDDYIDCEYYLRREYELKVSITMNGVELDGFQYVGVFRIGVAKEMTNGQHNLILNDNYVIKWDGLQYDD